MNPNDRTDDEWARRVLTDAVGDVEPADRLAEIRQRTARPRRRPGWPVVGAVLATAATVVVAAIVAWQVVDRPRSDPAPPASTPSNNAQTQRAVAVYYVGDTPSGPRLYREFRRVEVDEGTDPVSPALELMMAGPADPDYRTIWEPGDLDPMVSFDGNGSDGLYQVTLLDSALTERPDGMTTHEARLAVQQLIYTLHAAAGAADVQVFVEQERVPLLGIGYPSPRDGLPKAPQLDVLAHVSISDPEEGAVVGDTMLAKGRASSFEANVPWEIRNADGEVVLEGFVTAEGWMDRLYPWRTEIDVNGLEPGEYTFVAQTDDPSGGAEGAGPHSDTRTFVVE